MSDKLMYIPNVNKQNYLFCILQLVVESFDTKLNKPTNQNSLNVPIAVKPTKMKTLYNTLGTSAINIQLFPFSLC